MRAAFVVVAAHRLLDPGQALAVEGAAAARGFRRQERLVVVAHQDGACGNALLHRARRGDVSLDRRVAEPQLDRLEALVEQLLRLVGQPHRVGEAEAVAVIGRHRARRAAEQAHERHAGGARQRVPARHVDAGHGDGDMALRPEQAEAALQPRVDIGGCGALALDRGEDVPRDAVQRRGRGADAERIGAPGDALLGLEVEQRQQRRRHLRDAGAERAAHRHRDGAHAQVADLEIGNVHLRPP